MTVSTKPAIRWSELKTTEGATAFFLAAIVTGYFFYGLLLGSETDFAYGSGLVFGILLVKVRMLVLDYTSQNAP